MNDTTTQESKRNYEDDPLLAEAAWNVCHTTPLQYASPASRGEYMAIGAAVEKFVLSRQSQSILGGELSDDDLWKVGWEAWDRLCARHADINSWHDVLASRRYSGIKFLRAVLASIHAASPRIYTKCPACGNDTLTVNEDKHLLCTRIDCPDPTLIDKGPLPATPGYYVTAERPPTKEDGDFDGRVRAARYGSRDGWTWLRWDAVCKEAANWPLWYPIPAVPPAPVSPVTAEDAAFDAALQSHDLSALCEVQPNNRTILRTLFDAGRNLGKSEGTK